METRQPVEPRTDGEQRPARRWADRHPEAARRRQRHRAGPARRRAGSLPGGRDVGGAELSRSRAFLYRFRDPLIGLAVAGVAAPLVRAGAPAGAGGGIEEAAADDALEGSIFAGDLEEQLSERWAAAEASSAREGAIQTAMTRYRIPRDLAQDIHDYAQRNNIDPDIAYGLVKTESTFNERAVSHVGARGLTQVMPRTANWLRPGTSANDLFDRSTNLDLGFSYLDDLIEKYRGDVRLALLAYNRGPGTVDRILRRGGNPDNGYAAKVLRGGF
jgi:soluble lytic murein transglycosylase-like protein